MERKLRFVWWGILGILLSVAVWKLCLPHGTKAFVNTSTTVREIVVYVSGAVEKPGLIHLQLDARLEDALQQAIPLSNANLEALNPAEKLKDGQKITIPIKQVPIETSPNMSVQNSTGSVAPTGGAASVAAGIITSNSAGKVNINTANTSELDTLPGVGPVLAQRIVQYREEHGKFVSPEDLQEVAGIGAKTYEKMAAQVTVGP